MPKIVRYTVVPKLPGKLGKLRELAYNQWWCWDPEAVELFFRIDRDVWVDTNQSPVQMLGRLSQTRLEELAADDSFLAHLERVSERFMQYMSTAVWREKNPDAPEGFTVAYFSAEFGLHEAISIYSGGLGVLAGDHLKAASDLGIPFVAVGLLYREGYFRQYLNADGWQQEQYPQNDFYNMPIEIERNADGEPVIIEVDYPERVVKARVWRCQVGRTPLFLMDSDFDQNDPDGQEITARLYGGDRDTRMRQEIMLGIGGVKLLRTLGINPTVFHMNEGHSAFSALERARQLVLEEGLSLSHAIEAVKCATVFTTHTPVPAGNDMFTPDMIGYYFSKYAGQMGMSTDALLGLGRQDPGDTREPFCMTVLAMKFSASVNGVSKLHGEVARGMWSRTWPGVPKSEVPITSITNGVHTRFWISRDLAGLYDRYLGPSWLMNPADESLWERIDNIPDAELWRTHERRRERLVNFARRRLVAQLEHRGVPKAEIQLAAEALDPEVLTIGFGRRFATYKRANLFLMNEERLKRILTQEGKEVQFIIAGKAHPQDNQGKEVIRRIIHFARDPEVRNHVLFIEDYDINVARYMVQGIDCWLNTPRRPMEASGTSGMKAAANGALNISVPDGWWCEAELLGENGWSIGRGETYQDPNEQDLVESEALYDILEKEVVPIFYDRGRDGLPREWIQRMKTAIRTICPVFNTNRMVQEYADRFYIPCSQRSGLLQHEHRRRSQSLAEWKEKVRGVWNKVGFVNVETGPTEDLPYGTMLSIAAELFLDGLTNEDVVVEAYYGDLDSKGNLVNGQAVPMRYQKQVRDNIYRFEGAIACEKTGQQGCAVRVVPHHPDLHHKHETALIAWA